MSIYSPTQLGHLLIVAIVALAGCVTDGDLSLEDVESSSSALIETSAGARPGVALAVGDRHACALTKGGGVRCWGSNQFGQLGDGTTAQRATPVTVPGLTNVVALAAGAFHTCAALANGTARCWGRNNSGQLGDGTTIQRPSPVTVAGLTHVKDLAAGSYHSCAVRANGDARCWGQNYDGQLGIGTTTGSTTPVTVATYTDWKQLTAGNYHTCGLRAGGRVYCWGWNYFGQLGINSTSSRSLPTFAVSQTDRRQVVAGAYHSCSLADNGRAHCWGYNSNGQIGDGTTTTRLIGVQLAGISEVGYLAAGGHNTCGIRTVDGQTRCWGSNHVGQVGNGSTSASVLSPSTVGNLGATEVELGASAQDNFQGTSCAVKAGGDVVCWGLGSFGQMGNGTTTEVNPSPVVVALGSAARSTLSIGHSTGEVLVIRPDGSNRAWRWVAGESATPTGPMFTTPRMVSRGLTHSCVILSDGTVQCWGRNDFGQLGDGTAILDRPDPVDVVGLLDFEAVHLDVAYDKSCAVLTDGTVRCWGWQAGYSLGNGVSIEERMASPVAVLGLENLAVQVSTAGGTGCALLVDGRVSCWGTGTNSPPPLGGGESTGSVGAQVKPTAGLTDPLAAPAIAIAGGWSVASWGSHCALLATGQVQCWGYLPGNNTEYTGAPKLVSLGSGGRAVAVDTCGLNTCVVMADGTLRCWGHNDYGQLGLGFVSSPQTQVKVPLTVPGVSNVTAVAINCQNFPEGFPYGGASVCIVNASSQVYCWGGNFPLTPQYQMTL